MKERNALVSNLVNCELCQLFLLWKYFEEGFYCSICLFVYKASQDQPALTNPDQASNYCISLKIPKLLYSEKYSVEQSLQRISKLSLCFKCKLEDDVGPKAAHLHTIDQS